MQRANAPVRYAAPTEPSAPRVEVETGARRVYTSPRLERLGVLEAMTLQQSIPIGPGGL